MAEFGLSAKWAYYFPTKPEWFGLSEQKRKELIQSADVLINVSGTLENQRNIGRSKNSSISIPTLCLRRLKPQRVIADLRSRVDAHDVHFTFGECLGKNLPDTGHFWHPTRQPSSSGMAFFRTTSKHVHNHHELDELRGDNLLWANIRTEGRRVREVCEPTTESVSDDTLEVALHKALSWPAKQL